MGRLGHEGAAADLRRKLFPSGFGLAGRSLGLFAAAAHWAFGSEAQQL